MSKKIMKRSLALGALMAFVITGNAFAGTLQSTKYHQLEGNQEDIKINVMSPVKDYITGDGERLIGGWHTVSENNNVTAVNTDFKVTGGNFGYIVGGNWNQNDISVTSTNVVIDGATAKQVYAGTAFSKGVTNENVEQLSDAAAGRTTSLTILSGTFGGEVDNTNIPEMLVAGGDFVKVHAEENQTTYDKINTVVDEANVKISGGTFNAAVLGGSAVIRTYCYGDESSIVKSVVNNANITITGGEFYDPIVAGGLVRGHRVESEVKSAVINITKENNDIVFETGADIYAGGIVDGEGYNEQYTYGDNGTENDGSVVKKTTINIENVDVQNIYGTDGYIIPVALGEAYTRTDNNSPSGFKHNWVFVQSYTDNNNVEHIGQAVNTTLSLTNVTAQTVDVPEGSVTMAATSTGSTTIQTLKVGNDVALTFTTDGATNDALEGKPQGLMDRITVGNAGEGQGETNLSSATCYMEKGSAVGKVTFKVDAEGNIIQDSVQEAPHEGNAGVTHNANIALMAWRAETNDMNKRMGELRNSNGEHGVWARMVGGEDEFKDAKYEYNQYQLGYDEKLSVDPSWTVGVALSYTDGESSFTDGSGENTHKGLSVYGSKLNNDGSFIDLIAKYSRLEHDLTLEGDKGDYSTNGYSVSAEYGKRFQQGKGLWVEPQVELTYGKVKSAEYKLGQKTVSQDAMESLVGRVGFSLGKDISKGNVYARASYLYDFEGDTNVTFTNGATRNFAYDLGGGWWEVGVGANINLSKATYIYADIEKTFGGEVDTNWQWNLGVRYSF